VYKAIGASFTLTRRHGNCAARIAKALSQVRGLNGGLPHSSTEREEREGEREKSESEGGKTPR